MGDKTLIIFSFEEDDNPLMVPGVFSKAKEALADLPDVKIHLVSNRSARRIMRMIESANPKKVKSEPEEGTNGI